MKGKLPSHSGITFVSGHLRVRASENGGRQDREIERGVSRDRSIHSGVRLCKCVLVAGLFASSKKAFNRAFICPSLMHTDVLKTLHDTLLCLQASGRLA